jgi:hypothetical protein
MKYPEMRKELISTMKCLSDRNYQRTVWIEKKYPKGVVDDNFDYAVHFLFDDTCLAEDPKKLIGYALKNEKECDLVTDVIDALNILFEKLGTNLSDEQYINSPFWEKVIETSKKAYEEILT